MSRTTQCQQIKAALEAGQRLTPMHALKQFGCFRLGARIYDLKKEGMPIVKDMVKRGDTFVAEYRLQ